MRIRRWFRRLLLCAIFAFPGSLHAQFDSESSEPSGPPLPITQYAIAAVFVSLAFGAVLRSSRRHWN